MSDQVYHPLMTFGGGGPVPLIGTSFIAETRWRAGVGHHKRVSYRILATAIVGIWTLRISEDLGGFNIGAAVGGANTIALLDGVGGVLVPPVIDTINVPYVGAWERTTAGSENKTPSQGGAGQAHVTNTYQFVLSGGTSITLALAMVMGID